MNKQKLWIRRSINGKCAGCNEKLKLIFKDNLCTACKNTHPDTELIQPFLKNYYDNLTNNFYELPNTTELWVKIDEEYTFKVLYKDDYWHECIVQKGEPEVFIKMDEDQQAPYMYHALAALEIYSRVQKEEEIDFAHRIITFCRQKSWYDGKSIIDTIIIQTEHEDSSGTYGCDVIEIDRKKWIEIKDFFVKSAAMFLSGLIKN